MNPAPSFVCTVTFDSNVWESVVDKDKRTHDSECFDIYQAIKCGVIRPYFFEGIITLEAVQRRERKSFFTEYQPTISIQIGDAPRVIRPGTPAPELSAYLKNLVPQAVSLGFKFIRLTRIGFPIGPEAWAASDEFYSLEKRLERSFEFADYVESLHEGSLDLSIGNKSSVVSENKYASYIAELSDMDALAAHYGYGIDIFCTRDRGASAGAHSVLSPNFLQKLKKRFGLKVMSPRELLMNLKLPSSQFNSD